MNLSPSQAAVLACLKKGGVRYLPRGAVIDTENDVLAMQLGLFGCRWEWSRTIDLEANTSDYRRRIHEINQMPGYKIIAFHAPWTGMFGSGYVKSITRHGYILIPPSQKEER